MSEYITPNYEVISVIQKRDLMKLMNSSLLNAFSDKEMSLTEVEKELGYKVKIVNKENKND